jgi:hypothetical protein
MSGRVRLVFASLLLAVGTGCPHDWMIGGTMDEAMQKDLQEEREARRECPPHLPRERVCYGPNNQPPCRWICTE